MSNTRQVVVIPLRGKDSQSSKHVCITIFFALLFVISTKENTNNSSNQTSAKWCKTDGSHLCFRQEPSHGKDIFHTATPKEFHDQMQVLHKNFSWWRCHNLQQEVWDKKGIINVYSSTQRKGKNWYVLMVKLWNHTKPSNTFMSLFIWRASIAALEQVQKNIWPYVTYLYLHLVIKLSQLLRYSPHYSSFNIYHKLSLNNWHTHTHTPTH